MKKLGLVALLVVLTLIATPTIVQADPWSAIDSGYAISTNHPGEEIDITQPFELKAKVGFLASIDVDKVIVELRDPDDNVVDTAEVVAPWQTGWSKKGNEYKWNWTRPLDPAKTGNIWVVGHYSVKAYFYAKAGQGWKNLANVEDRVSMRAFTVMTVPEVPIGTITILLTMLASLVIFARKKF